MAKKKGGGKGKKGGKGGKKGGGGGGGATMAVGVHRWQESSVNLWKVGVPTPVPHRPAPSMPSHRAAPAAPMVDAHRLPVFIVRAGLAGDLSIVKHWLMRGGSVDATWDRPDGSTKGFTLLMLAALQGQAHHVELMDLLLHKMADADLTNSGGHTALMLAAANNKHTAVQRLLSAGAKTSKRAIPPMGVDKGPTALDLATRNEHEFTRVLIVAHEAAADYGMPSHQPITDLPRVVQEAAVEGDEEKVVEWLEVGGPIEARWHQADDSLTLLLLAAKHGHEAMVGTLLKRNASTEATNRGGDTAMKVAAFRGHSGVTRLLLRHQLKHREAPAMCSPRVLEELRAPKEWTKVPIPKAYIEFRRSSEPSEQKSRWLQYLDAKVVTVPTWK